MCCADRWRELYERARNLPEGTDLIVKDDEVPPNTPPGLKKIEDGVTTFNSYYGCYRGTCYSVHVLKNQYEKIAWISWSKPKDNRGLIRNVAVVGAGLGISGGIAYLTLRSLANVTGALLTVPLMGVGTYGALKVADMVAAYDLYEAQAERIAGGEYAQLAAGA